MLTRKRVEALKWIAEFVEREGYPPGGRAVGAAMGGRSRQQGWRYVRALVRDGFLAPSVHGFTVTPEGEAFVRGQVAQPSPEATAEVEA